MRALAEKFAPDTHAALAGMRGTAADLACKTALLSLTLMRALETRIHEVHLGDVSRRYISAMHLGDVPRRYISAMYLGDVSRLRDRNDMHLDSARRRDGPIPCPCTSRRYISAIYLGDVSRRDGPIPYPCTAQAWAA